MMSIGISMKIPRADEIRRAIPASAEMCVHVLCGRMLEEKLGMLYLKVHSGLKNLLHTDKNRNRRFFMDKKKSVGQNLKEEAATALERTKANAQQAKGVVKEALGKATDNPKLKAEGKIDQVAGKTKDSVAKLKDAVRDTAEKVHKEIHKKH